MVLPWFLASDNFTLPISALQLDSPRQLSVKWYFFAPVLLHMYTSLSTTVNDVNGKSSNSMSSFLYT